MPRKRSMWIYEHRTAALASRRVFLRRVCSHVLMFVGVVGTALVVGILGYRTTEGMSWLDSYLNAAMILGGMGPVGELHTRAGKLFAGTYAMFAGVVFLVMIGVVLTPYVHRVLHRLHLETEKEAQE